MNRTSVEHSEAEVGVVSGERVTEALTPSRAEKAGLQGLLGRLYEALRLVAVNLSPRTTEFLVWSLAPP
ncbi:MAG: hypothetical protein RMJ82_02540 [Gemmatales bacterium]|nr:hypothetical protein [Gemmatales bacterium]